MTHRTGPLVLVPACNRVLDGQMHHVVGAKYVEAVRLTGALPLVVPVATADELSGLLDISHGVLLTGSPSNVHPSRFGEDLADAALPLDPARDAWTLPLIPKALERGVPLLAICRGAQEVNVALGGTLHQAVHEVPPNADHRSRDDDPLEVQYGPSHVVHVTAGGVLERLTGRSTFDVNSLHGQAVRQLAPGLRVEAHAPDGLVEAFSAADAPGFNLCVQWHPEWRAADNPVSMCLLRAFGDACRAYREGRRGSGP